jgi:hypothetical protein
VRPEKSELKVCKEAEMEKAGAQATDLLVASSCQYIRGHDEPMLVKERA